MKNRVVSKFSSGGEGSPISALEKQNELQESTKVYYLYAIAQLEEQSFST